MQFVKFLVNNCAVLCTKRIDLCLSRLVDFTLVINKGYVHPLVLRDSCSVAFINP